MKSKTLRTDFRYDESDLYDVKTFLGNKRLALSSLRFLKSGIFIPLPFSTWCHLIDNLPETKWQPIIEQEKQIANSFEDLENFLNQTKAWCQHAKRTPIDAVFFAKADKINNKLEYLWCHNFGISNNNWSRIFYSSLIESDLMNDWNVIDNNLGVSQLSISFEQK